MSEPKPSMTPEAGARQGELPSQIDRLEREICELESALQNLDERLSPITTVAPPAELSDKIERVVTTQYASQIYSCATRVDAITGHIHNLNARLEV
jgi:hypothetical protein